VIVECPHRGRPVVVNGFGRRPLNIPVTKVYDALHRHHSVTAAARELGCSRGYIYKILKDSGHASSLPLPAVANKDASPTGAGQQRTGSHTDCSHY